ncbi:hypothetical protein GOP47_0001906 [Adiantum capillus-veneris]|uniref:LOB domain-containing protein n=1 Tax=Adiantum capillus-veneris TaxID=13818 RepID=A0A9D4ZNJ0_ADICA|nr:hypothetical protein GOP47_0001906 [Adiantum capillus-veneris]
MNMQSRSGDETRTRESSPDQGTNMNNIMQGQAQGANSRTAIPCAACKLLRRKCVQECPFAPYFPPTEPHKFASVHKIFGASNVSKMLMEVPEHQRADVANSLVYEANARIRDPVYGCLGAISTLQQEAQALQSELHAVRTQIMRYSGASLVAPLAFKVPSSIAIHVSSTSLSSSTQTTVNSGSNEQYTMGSPESTMASVDLKDHYWSQLHQSC